jgi:hypothetical protein
MNCAACDQSINRFGGYYLVGNRPYCSGCFKRTNRHRNTKHLTQTCTLEWEDNNLLEEFRAYQERERQSACRSY